MRVKGGELNGFLDKGSHLQGELRFEDTFRIDGRCTGTVISEGDLIVGVGGEVEGEIRTSRVYVSGTVRGRIQVSRRVEIAAGGRVFAEIETPSLVVEDGALFEGRCAMTPARASELAAPSGPRPLSAVLGRGER